jgi:hypothetical protein
MSQIPGGRHRKFRPAKLFFFSETLCACAALSDRKAIPESNQRFQFFHGFAIFPMCVVRVDLVVAVCRFGPPKIS